MWADSQTWRHLRLDRGEIAWQAPRPPVRPMANGLSRLTWPRVDGRGRGCRGRWRPAGAPPLRPGDRPRSRTSTPAAHGAAGTVGARVDSDSASSPSPPAGRRLSPSHRMARSTRFRSTSWITSPAHCGGAAESRAARAADVTGARRTVAPTPPAAGARQLTARREFAAAGCCGGATECAARPATPDCGAGSRPSGRALQLACGSAPGCSSGRWPPVRTSARRRSPPSLALGTWSVAGRWRLRARMIALGGDVIKRRFSTERCGWAGRIRRRASRVLAASWTRGHRDGRPDGGVLAVNAVGGVIVSAVILHRGGGGFTPCCSWLGGRTCGLSRSATFAPA